MTMRRRQEIYGEAVTTAKKGRTVLITDDYDIKMFSNIAPQTLEIVGPRMYKNKKSCILCP